MPSKKTIFTPSSILFRPQHNPAASVAVEIRRFRRIVVEAPGTAPGSEWFISPLIYRHIRLRGTPYIGCPVASEKGASGPPAKSGY